MFLEIKNTDFGYETPLLKGVETTLDLGQVCLLIGNNGVGKTTLIKSVLNQIPVLNGEIFINQKNIRKLSSKEIAEQVAVVFSKSQIPANYTVRDLIALGKYIYYPYYFELSKADQEETQYIIEQLELSKYSDYRLSNLSDGNLQKAFIGRALAQNSRAMILDEPTTHLDEDNKIMILQLLRKLAEEQNKLVMFSSHDWRLAKEFADRIWYFKDFNIYSGIAEDVISQHSELLKPQLFHMHDDFVVPQINAPEIQKELLYSFLQKNYKTDLSEYQFTFSESIWRISTVKFQQKAHNFEEILTVLPKQS